MGGASGRKLDSTTTASIILALKYPPHFFQSIVNYAERVLPSDHQKAVLITSPFNIADEFHKVGRDFKGYKFFTTHDTMDFLTRHRQDCEAIDNWFGEVLSELEKELLIYAKAFFRARPSNWSFNVQGHRTAKFDTLDHDRYIYDLFKNEKGILP